MTRFVKVSDDDSQCDFINLDQVTKIQFEVEVTGGGIDLSNFSSENDIQPSEKKRVAVITLLTANGTGRILFNDPEKASQWAQEHLDISIPFDQM